MQVGFLGKSWPLDDQNVNLSTRIGGYPIIKGNPPICVVCGNTMEFLALVDTSYSSCSRFLHFYCCVSVEEKSACCLSPEGWAVYRSLGKKASSSLEKRKTVPDEDKIQSFFLKAKKPSKPTPDFPQKPKEEQKNASFPPVEIEWVLQKAKESPTGGREAELLERYLKDNSVDVVGSGDSMSEGSLESFDSSDGSEGMLFWGDTLGCVMRYAFGDKPRIVDSRERDKAVPCCQNCSAPRVFEIQFFSSLFSKLLDKINGKSKIQEVWLKRLEDSSVTLCVFSCAKDCDSETLRKKNLTDLFLSDLRREYVGIYDQ